MATTELRADAERMRVVKWGLGIAAGSILLGIVFHFATRPPQMGVDEDAFKTVDALYTAVRLKDDTKLTLCESRLHAYRDAGKLAPSASEFLDDVMATARAGKWERATQRLYEFMLAQRREGRSTAVEEKPQPKKPVKR